MSNRKFMVNKASDADWQTGLRSFFEYRDIGVAEATGGEFGAQIVRARAGGGDEGDHGTSMHRHGTGFHLVFVLKGECTFWFKGYGEIDFKQGDCWFQPDGLVHEERSVSNDFEVLEINSPHDFLTTDQ